METELLIIKRRDRYVRVGENDYSFVGLDKASVFPLDNIHMAREHLKALQERGDEDAVLFILKLNEEPYACGSPGGNSAKKEVK